MNKISRIMSHKNKYETAKPLYDYFELLNLQKLIKHNHGKFMWKLVNNLHPECIQSKYKLTQSSAINKTDSKTKFILPYFRKNVGQMSLYYQSLRCWNTEIPDNFKINKSYKLFAKDLKTHFLKLDS